MMDSLKRRVLARDKLNNSERQMRATEREVTDKRICLECRRVPDELAIYHAWLKEDSRHTWREYTGLQGTCPACGGKLIEVTW